MAMMNPYNYKKPVNVNIKPMGPKPTDLNAPPKIINKQNAYNKKTNNYLEQKIMSAKPEELTLMLYDGIIKFINQTKIFNDQNDIEKSSNSNLRAQAIIEELRATLDLDIAISLEFEVLYIFMNERLIDANLSKDNEILDEVLEIATEFRDTWKTAMKL